MATYNQYIFPKTKIADGSLIEMRVNFKAVQPYAATSLPAINTAWVQSDQTSVFIIQKQYGGNAAYRWRTAGGVAAIQQLITGSDAKISPDAREITIIDSNGVTGVDGTGAAISLNFLTVDPSDVDSNGNQITYGTLCNKIFYDPLSSAYIMFGAVLPATRGTYSAGTAYLTGDIVNFGGDTWQSRTNQTGVTPGVENNATWILAREFYFGGAGQGEMLTAEHQRVYAERTKHAQQVQICHLKIDGCAQMFNSILGHHLMATIAESDMIKGGPLPGYAGLVFEPGKKLPNGGLDYTQIHGYGYEAHWTDAGHGTSLITSYEGVGNRSDNKAVTAGISVNAGLHWIRLSTIVSKICAIGGFLHDPANDLLSNNVAYTDTLDWTATAAADNSSSRLIQGSFKRKPVPPISSAGVFDLAVIYEWFMGMDPRCDWNAAQISSDITFDWDAPVADMLNAIMTLTVTSPRIEYDQFHKQPRLRLIDQRYPSFPSATSNQNYVGSNFTASTLANDTTFPVVDASALELNRAYPYWALAHNPTYTQTELVKVTRRTTNTLTVIRTNPALVWSTSDTVHVSRQLPTKNFVLTPSSTTGPRAISAQHVEVTLTGDSDVLASPTKRGKALTFENRWACKAYGQGYVPGLNDIIYNGQVAQENQESIFHPFAGGHLGSGRHILITDATLTRTTFFGTSGSTPAFQLHSPTHDFTYPSEINVANNGPGGDFVCLPGYGIEQNGVVLEVIDRNTIIFNQGLGFGLAAGTTVFTNVHCTIGYDFNGTDLSALSRPDTAVGSFVCNFLDYVGQNLIIPSVGVFKIVNTYASGGQYYAVLDRSFDLGVPLGTFVPFRVGGPDLNPDFMVAARMLYYYTDTDCRFPPLFYTLRNSEPHFANQWKGVTLADPVMSGGHTFTQPSDAQYITGPGFFSGMYTVTAWQYNGRPNGADASYCCTQYSNAQAYASINFGNPVSPKRVYDGCRADDGSLTGYSVRDGFTEQIGGAVRNFMTIGLGIDEFRNPTPRVTVQAVEIPDIAAAIDASRFPVWSVGNGTTSASTSSVGNGAGGGGVTGPASGGTTGGTTTDSSADVITKPNAPKRNLIQASSPGIVPIEVELVASSTSDLIDAWDSNGTTLLFGVDYLGNLSANSFNFAAGGQVHGLINMNTHSVQNVVDPVNAQDAATKHYVDGAVGAIVLPTVAGTTNRITVTGSGNYTVDIASTYVGQASITTLGTVTTGVWNGTTIDIGHGGTNATTAALALVNLNGVTLTPTSGTDNIIQPTGSTATALTLKQSTTGSTDLFEVRDSSSNTYFKIDGTGHPVSNKAVTINETTNTALTVTNTGNGNSLAIATAATAAGALNIVNITNTGTGGRGQHVLNANGTVTWGPMDKTSALTAGAGFSGNLALPVHTLSANTTLSGVHSFVRVNTTSGTLTMTLPANTTNGGPTFKIAKVAAGNTLNVNNSGGTLVKSWTANNTAFEFRDNGTNWDVF